MKRESKVSDKMKKANGEKVEPVVLHAYCARCRHKHAFVQTSVNHWFHFILSVFTLGLWLVSWAAVCIGKLMRPWRCEHCGWHKPEFRLHREIVERTDEEVEAPEIYADYRINV